MAGVRGATPAGHRILATSMDGVGQSGDTDAASVIDMTFGFYETASDTSWEAETADDFDENETVDACNAAENKLFWESQQLLLHRTLSRGTYLEVEIRKCVKEISKNTKLTPTICMCERPIRGTGGCRKCAMKDASNSLRTAGYNSAICKAKWRSTKDIPAGEHTYIDVVENSGKEEVRVVIDLNFRAEFEMARASEEYNRLIGKLPENFVGKADKLRNVIKIVCSGAKKCMKDKNMHMGPWRKNKYMQAKWFGCYTRIATEPPLPPAGISNRLQRPKESLLTFDLLQNMPALHCTATAVKVL